MTWSRVQSSAGSASNAASVTASYTSNVSAGNKLIALVSSDIGAGVITSVKDGAGNAFTQVAGAVIAGQVTVTLWAMDVPAGDAGTKPAITALFPMGSDLSMLIQEVSGLAPGNTLAAMIDGTAGTATGSVSPTTSPAYSSTVAGEYLVCCFGDNLFGDTYTDPAGYTADPSNTTGSVVHVAICYKNSGAGAESGSYSFTGAAHYGAILVAFNLANPPPSGSGALGLDAVTGFILEDW